MTEAVYRHELRPVLLDGARGVGRIVGGGHSPRTALVRSGRYPVGYSEKQKGHHRRCDVPFELVGVAGFEPTTSASRTQRAAKLRYTPIRAVTS